MLQEQYKVHSSENPLTSGTRYAPFRYGLKPTRYRVRHFGHSTQWRIRVVMAHIVAGPTLHTLDVPQSPVEGAEEMSAKLWPCAADKESLR